MADTYKVPTLEEAHKCKDLTRKILCGKALGPKCQSDEFYKMLETLADRHHCLS